MSIRSIRRPRRATTLLGLVLAGSALVATACPELPPSGGGTTSTTGPTTTGPTTTAPSTIRTLTNASFEWTVSREADHGSNAPGQANYWSAGESDSTSATYVPTNGNATVLKKNAGGTYVPIGSEPSVDWTKRNADGTGTAVGATSANFLGQKVRYTGGTGTVNTATGAATIQWTGTFTINFYGKYVPFWIKNPKLVVNSSGVGQLTATVAGFASSLADPDVRTPLPATNVVIADFTGIASANTTGFTKAPKYLDTLITAPSGSSPQIAKTSGNTAHWGSWPQSFVNFQGQTGLGSYWYTSGGNTDAQKPQEPVVVAYNLTS